MLKSIISGINFDFWSINNPYFSDDPLINSIKTGLAYARTGGLIEDVVAYNGTMTNVGLVNIIKTSIEKCCSDSAVSETDYLRVFDLIRGWGGQMGRGIYVKPKARPYRLSDKDKIARYYRESVANIRRNDVDSALIEMTNIKYIGESFGTKHLYFWSKFSEVNLQLPIYDERIKTLLYFSARRAPKYSDYIRDLASIGQSRGIDIEQVERSLFAFSSNWFQNARLEIVNRPIYSTDSQIAMRLSKLWHSEASMDAQH